MRRGQSLLQALLAGCFMAVTRCPHCSAENHPSAAFCVSCGKALPGQDPLMPRVITESRAAKSELGKGLLSDELKKQLKKATTALLAVCILQLIGGTIIEISFLPLRNPWRDCYHVWSHPSRLEPSGKSSSSSLSWKLKSGVAGNGSSWQSSWRFWPQ